MTQPTSRDTAERAAPPRLRVVMFVMNPGNQDSRVLREAETLRGAGHQLTLVAVPRRDIKDGPDRDRIGELEVLRVHKPAYRRRLRNWRDPRRYLSRVWSHVRSGALLRAALLLGAGVGAAVLAVVLAPFVLFVRARPDSSFADLVQWLLRWRFGDYGWSKLASDVAPAADVYHGHDLNALPAAYLAARKRGALLVYDSHEIFTESGRNAGRPAWARRLFSGLERRWSRDAAAIVTVNHDVADVLRKRLRPERIVVVHNTPARWSPNGSPDLLRRAAGVPEGCFVALSHGGFSRHRGLEEFAESVLEPGMEDVHAVLMGYGQLEDEIRALAAEARFGGRVHVLPAVPPAELIEWVASADVGVMAIHPTTLNHRLSTPNKLFECLAAGVPVVASDLPGMRRIILEDPANPLGELCDPTDPASIAAAIRRIIELPPAARAELRARCLRAAHERWNWETESRHLLDLYEDLAHAVPRPTEA